MCEQLCATVPKHPRLWAFLGLFLLALSGVASITLIWLALQGLAYLAKFVVFV